jgi:hypothetical protein
MKKLYILLILIAPAISFAQWTTSGTNVFHNTTGLAGIGTATATTFTNAKLNVYKSGNGTAVLIGNPNIASGNFTSLRLGTSADLNGYSFINSIKSAAATPVYGDLVLNQAGGNVGIGTTTPSAKLNVYQAGASTRLILGNPLTGSGGFTSLILGTSADKNGYSFLSSIKSSGTAMGDLVLSPDGGNVGIGKVPASTYKLDVNGALNATSILVGGQPISGGTSQWTTTGSDIVYNAGRVGIGTTAPPEKLTVQGNIQIPLATSIGYLQSSDKFVHNGNTIGNYSIGWANDSWMNGAPTSYYSGFGGIKFFTNVTPRLVIDYLGNIGIGTTSPSSKLHILAQAAGTAGLQIQGQNGDTWFPYVDGKNYVRGTTILADAGGNVGIGTTSPQEKFHLINGAIMTSDPTFFNINAKLDASSGIPVLKFTRWIGSGQYQHNAFVGQFYNPQLGGEYSLGLGTGQSSTGDQNATSTTMTLTLAGSVGIGTTNPGSYKLAVAGKIAATGEVKVFVDGTTNFPDYVFDPSYKLPTLEETEKYIQENHHLPEVPTAADIAKDGMSLNEMNIILLKKVEELTLHLIEMKKDSEAIRKENEELKKRLEKLEKK